MWTKAHRIRIPYPLLALVLAWTVSGLCRPVPAAAIEAALLLMDAPWHQADAAPVNPAVVLRQRSVAWDPQLFAARPPERLVLNLFDDSLHTATLLTSEQGPAGDVVWDGHIDGQPDSRVTLVVHGASASALIRIGGCRFDLRPVAPPLHVIQEINVADPSAFQPYDAETAQYPGRALSPAGQAATTQTTMTSKEFTVFTLVNEERSKHDLFPLNPDHRLTAAARDHSRDMADNDYFSHTSPDGRTVGDRVTDAGYIWSRVAENIARGHTSPEAVVLGWMNSEGHRRNILSADFCDLGVGYVSTGRYWTQKFGRLRDVTVCEPQDPDESNGGSRGESGSGCLVGALGCDLPPRGSRI